ncbi:CHAP domain-containing protein [Nocardioides acrostichi]|uniref:CHAP domain-containing protein n=1 Tax=Nocardioides acrostichi TaxID=2784339 RepID=A0A930Y4G1_9ACTN|nr:CHAP domain-containing protein [Nocardioides acrostichi]MBF4160145.1 CHAP domain-containing protein [Nocardioides acrostichi]
MSFTAAVVTMGVPFLAPSPAQADQVALCNGYDGCAAAGYGNSGYAQHNGTMYWNMYAGHNCTNYVAYRMYQAGITSRPQPWNGSGNGYNWGHVLSKYTDQTPQVGAVAWFDKYHGYAGSNGHVAYVEKVISSTEILVSEDMWNGTFHWRRLTKSGTGWPSGFIHLGDRSAQVVERPSVSGTNAVGGTMTADVGSYDPKGAVALQWYAAGKPIGGATDATYTLTPGEVRKRVWVQVTSTADGYGSVSARSNRSRKIQPGTLETVNAPRVEGTAQVDKTLRVRRGSYSPVPSASSVQWYADGTAIDGATRSRLPVTPDLVGKALTPVVTATLDGYRDLPASGPATDAVLPGPMRAKTTPTLTGKPMFGETLVVHPGSYSRDTAQETYTWTRDGQEVTGDAVRDGGLRYKLGSADIGHTISVQVSGAELGYETVTTDLAADQVRPAPMQATQQPTLTGTERYGKRLVVHPGSYDRQGAKETYTWLRDGKPVTGDAVRGDGLVYRFGPADIGHSVTVRVAGVKEGYDTVTTDLGDDDLVTTSSELTADVVGKALHRGVKKKSTKRHIVRKIVVHAAVDAPGVATPDGPVTVKIDGGGEGLETTGQLVDGVIRLGVRGLEPGEHRVRVLYAGTDAIDADRLARRVTVPKR